MNILEKLNNLFRPIFGGLLGLILIYALIQLFDMLRIKISPDSSQAGGSVLRSFGNGRQLIFFLTFSLILRSFRLVNDILYIHLELFTISPIRTF